MVRNNTILKCLLFYLAFVIYGSLVPLEFRMLSFEQALDRFSNIAYLDLDMQSRADWVANILLFIPLAFFFNGYLWSRQRVKRQLLNAFLVIASCLVLSTGIEFTQLYFPQRTVSQNDIIAEGIGAIFGVSVWWVWGERFLLWLSQWQQRHASASIFQRLLLLYLAILYGYNLLPLDLTISPVEIYRSWREGRIILAPFSSLGPDPVENLYHLVIDTLIWVPVSFLLSARRSIPDAWKMTLGAALLLEFLQIFVYSRTTDTTDLITAAIGAAAGTALWTLYRRWGSHRTTDHSHPQRHSGAPYLWIAAVSFTAWTVILGIIFWYPYNFNTDRAHILEALSTLQRVPFHAYYFGTEFRAVTEVFHKVLFFMPYGILSVILFHICRPNVSPGSIRLFALVTGAFAGLVIESGQLFLPGKHADITDLMLEILGAFLGYWGASIVAEAVSTRHPERRPPPPSEPPLPPSKHPLAGPSAAVAIGMAGMLVAGSLALNAAGIPYNIRELFPDGNPLPGLAALSLALYWGLGMPAYLGCWLMGGQKGLKRALLFPLLISAHAGVMFFLIRAAVPTESIHDILGSPILHWPWEWELLWRFTALFGAVSLLLSCSAAMWVALPPFYSIRNRGKLRWLIAALLFLPAAHWVVVEQASTDNLTELMRYQGSGLSSMLIAAWLMILGATASLLSAAFARFLPGRALSLIIAFLSILPAYLLLYLGTEPAIQKYGGTFSALQFLLSADRLHLSDGVDLFVRYMIAQLSLTGMIALAQLPIWIFLANRRHRWELSRSASSDPPHPVAAESPSKY